MAQLSKNNNTYIVLISGLIYSYFNKKRVVFEIVKFKHTFFLSVTGHILFIAFKTTSIVNFIKMNCCMAFVGYPAYTLTVDKREAGITNVESLQDIPALLIHFYTVGMLRCRLYNATRYTESSANSETEV